MLARAAASQSRRRRVSASRRQPSRRAGPRGAGELAEPPVAGQWPVDCCGDRIPGLERPDVDAGGTHRRVGNAGCLAAGDIAGGGGAGPGCRICRRGSVACPHVAGGLPWVYSASVRRRWPDTLDIRVVEQLPIARWGDRGFLNHEGRVFAGSGRGEWSELPVIHGPAGTEQRLMQHYQRLRDLLAPAGLSVARLEQDGLGQLHAELQSGLRLNLGNEQFLLRVRRFLDLYRNDLVQRAAQVARVDLRYAKGAAVTFHEPPQLAAVDSHKRDQGD